MTPDWWASSSRSASPSSAAWRGRAPSPSEKLRQLPDDEAFLARAGPWIAEGQEAKRNDLLAAIFDYVGGPVAFDELVNVASALLQIRDEPPASTEERQEAGGAELASGADVAWQVEKRIFLERLWEEVRELPLQQRAALLLNLREADGRGCLALFPATGVATLRQIAGALEIPAERFAELWPRLPLDDATIASLLGLTRQQVINLRKSARERLARRLKGFFEGLRPPPVINRRFRRTYPAGLFLSISNEAKKKVTEHLSPAKIEDDYGQRLAPAELLGVDDHLAECVECRRLVESALNHDTVRLYAELATEAPIGPHLTFEQSAAYADSLLTGEERRAIEDHLASCARCAPMVADLRAFRNEIAPELGREYRPQGTAEAAPPQGTWRDRIVAALPSPFFRTPSWVYAPALLLLAVAGWVAWRAASNGGLPQVVHTSPTPAPSLTPPTPEAAPVLAQLNDGGSLLTLDAEGHLTGVDAWPPAYQQLAKDALSDQRVGRSPLLSGLSRPGSSLMGGDDEGRRFAVIEPVGKVTLTDRPTFRWSKLSGATGYVVEVNDAQFNPAASSPVLTTASWSAPPLARGRVYSWQVKAIRDGQEDIAPRPPAPQAKFRILDRATAAEIARARRDYASSHLLLGLLHARAGLLDEAEQEFRALQQANPNSAVVRQWLASLRATRR